MVSLTTFLLQDQQQLQQKLVQQQQQQEEYWKQWFEIIDSTTKLLILHKEKYLDSANSTTDRTAATTTTTRSGNDTKGSTTTTTTITITPSSLRQNIALYYQQQEQQQNDDSHTINVDSPWLFLLKPQLLRQPSSSSSSSCCCSCTCNNNGNNTNDTNSSASSSSSIDRSRCVYWDFIRNYAIPSNNKNTTTTTTTTFSSLQQSSHDLFTTSTGSSCTDAPGTGWEGGYGAYQLLTEKIQIFPLLLLSQQPSYQDQNLDQEQKEDSSINAVNDDSDPIIATGSTATAHPAHSIRVLCAVYTQTLHHESHIRMISVTWGHLCDGFLAFTTTIKNPISGRNTTITTTTSTNYNANNSTIINNPSLLGIISIPYSVGDESYNNMWQKTRAILHYLYTHQYHNEYDYVHLSGDDIYLIVPNLKYFLYQQEIKHQEHTMMQQQEQRQSKWGNINVFAGQWVRQKHYPFVGGGPGYTISRNVVVQFMKYAYNTCYTNIISSSEDRYFSTCIHRYTNISITDTRDVITGEQTYHDIAPQELYNGKSSAFSRRKVPSFHSRLLSYYETLPYPTNSTDVNYEPWRPISTIPNSNNIGNRSSNNPSQEQPPLIPVGPKYGLQSAAKFSISFHKIKHPLHMLRIHVLLYPILCR